MEKILKQLNKQITKEQKYIVKYEKQREKGKDNWTITDVCDYLIRYYMNRASGLETAIEIVKKEMRRLKKME